MVKSASTFPETWTDLEVNIFSRSAILCIIIFAILSSSSHSVSYTITQGTSRSRHGTSDSLVSKSKKLKELKHLADLDPQMSQEYRVQFFYEFPNDFRTFFELFGYDEFRDDSGYVTVNSHILTDESESMVFFLGEIESVPDSEVYDKLFNLAIGGFWQADGVGALLKILRDRIPSNIPTTCEVMSPRTDEEIEGFWRFYFDGPHPPTQIPDDLATIKVQCPRIYIQLEKALRIVQLKWKNAHD